MQKYLERHGIATKPDATATPSVLQPERTISAQPDYKPAKVIGGALGWFLGHGEAIRNALTADQQKNELEHDERINALGPNASANEKRWSDLTAALPWVMGGAEAAPAKAAESLVGADANPEVMKLVEGMRRQPQMRRITSIPVEHGQNMARAYTALPTFDPAAKPAYDALNKEVEQQFNALRDAGYTYNPVNEDPYKGSKAMMADVRDNKNLNVFKTPADNFHPYMTPEQNDRFRWVHDLLAHAGPGNQFGPVGEENAYRLHASTLSPEAQQALASETRGQNSWVNFGPNAHLPVTERPFAEQKAALWPEHLLGDYDTMTPAPTGRIAGAAIKLPDGSIHTGFSHWPAIENAISAGKLPDARDPEFDRILGQSVDGFVDDRGNFLTRDQTAKRMRQLGYKMPKRQPGRFSVASEDIRSTQGGFAPEATPQDPPAPIEAPNLNLGEKWQPNSRGVFDRSAPNIQGTIPSDPRLVVPAPKTNRMTTSPLVDAIVNSSSVRKGLDADVDKGLLMGGPEWYELGPVKADLDARDGKGMSFSDLNMMGGGASASNSVPNEFSAMSIMNHARVHGLSREEAVQNFLNTTRFKSKAPLMDMHMNLGFGGIKNGGAVLPSDPMSEAWKIPMYADKRMGGGGLLSVDAPGGMPALDTHERRRIMQLAMQDPSVAKLAQESGSADADVVPLRNALDYKAISGLYTDGAKRYGLPTSGAYQAPRWTGGWDKTGLKSPPTGDFVQLLEDALKYTAQQRGMDDSPAGLRNLWTNVVNGNDFILPWYKKGYYPIK